MLNNKEETVLVETLITHIINLNEKIDVSEEKLEIAMRRLRELTRENKELKDSKTVTYNIDEVTPF